MNAMWLWSTIVTAALVFGYWLIAHRQNNLAERVAQIESDRVAEHNRRLAAEDRWCVRYDRIDTERRLTGLAVRALGEDVEALADSLGYVRNDVAPVPHPRWVKARNEGRDFAEAVARPVDLGKPPRRQ